MSKPAKLLRLGKVCAVLGEISAKTVYAMVRRGELARPIQMTGESGKRNIPVWHEADVEDTAAYLRVQSRVESCQEKKEAPGTSWDVLERESEPDEP